MYTIGISMTRDRILAVALATVSCGKATTSEQEQTAGWPPVPAPSAATSQATPAVVAAISDDKADPNLLLLRTELMGETSEGAFAKQAHSRPLCDKDGYPLVGNMNRKGGGPQPSELCADIRAKKAKST